ncbi:MAG: shikimate kinase [Burkholderiales bacterium]|nr:shikimate kinase [Burkholderiales bacterium]
MKLKSFSQIILIGITGVGKTTVGKYLSEYIKSEFIDLDKSIEQRCGVDIPTIFEIEGEAGFRLRETNELMTILAQKSSIVLSVGGGCILSDENRQLMATENTFVVQLFANIEILVERLSKSVAQRPLFHKVDVETKIRELFKARQELYDSISDIKINTSFLKPNQVVETIVKNIQL